MNILSALSPIFQSYVIIHFSNVLVPCFLSIKIEGRDECECKPAYILTFPSMPGEVRAMATFRPRVSTNFQCSGKIGTYTIVSDPQTVNGNTLTCVTRIQEF